MKLLIRPINAIKEQAYVESLDLTKIGKQSETQILTHNNQMKPKESPKQTLTESKPIIESTQQTCDNEIKIKEDMMEVQETPNVGSDEAVAQTQHIQQMEVSSDESSDESEEILNYLGGNNCEILFKMSDLPKVSRKELPDEFYETTKDDLMHVLNDLRRQQVGNQQKLLETQQMREQKRKEQINKYKSTVVRVCFPNEKLVFQAIFKPTDTIEDVKRVLKHYITSVDFYLYTVPPKRILKSGSNLYESQLVPAALIHFGLHSSESKHVIKEEYKSKLSSYKSAAKIAAEARNCKQPDPNTTGNTTQQTQNDRTTPSTSGSSPKAKKVPKWFKTNH